MILWPRIGKGRVSEKFLICQTFQKHNHSISFLLIGPERLDLLRLQRTLSAISSVGTVLRNGPSITIMTQHSSKIEQAAIVHVGRCHHHIPERRWPKESSICIIISEVIHSLINCWVTPCTVNVIEPNVEERKIVTRHGLSGILIVYC